MTPPLAVLLLLSVVAACATRAGDQSSSNRPVEGNAQGPCLPGDNIPESASLLRRLAEAADGYRDGKERYVVADRKPHHKVLGVFRSGTEAEAECRRNRNQEGTDYDVFGPYRTKEVVAETYDSLEAVDTVIVITKNGKRKIYDGETVDALFWGLSAFDKFIAPYLTVVYSAEYAAKQRELYRRNQSPLAHSKTVPHVRHSF
ncbi:MAG: hypothetical protein ACREMX_09600 [Gemmatimonadales bacterium]